MGHCSEYEYKFEHTFQINESVVVPSISAISYDPEIGLIRTSHPTVIKVKSRTELTISGTYIFEEGELILIDYGDNQSILHQMKDGELCNIDLRDAEKNSLLIYEQLLATSYMKQENLSKRYEQVNQS